VLFRVAGAYETERPGIGRRTAQLRKSALEKA
jgi:hypothetical protein